MTGLTKYTITVANAAGEEQELWEFWIADDQECNVRRRLLKSIDGMLLSSGLADCGYCPKCAPKYTGQQEVDDERTA